MTRPLPQSFISAMILITKLIRYHHRCNKTKCSRKVREMILRYGRQGSEAWHVVVFVVLVFVVIVFLVVVFVVVIFIFVVFIAFVFVVGGWMYGHGGTGHLRGSHGLSARRAWNTKSRGPSSERPPWRCGHPAGPLGFNIIILYFLWEAGEGRKREGGKSWKVWKLWWKGRRGDYLFDAGAKMSYVPYN